MNKNFKYTPVKDMRPGYLKAKFDRIRAELRKQADAKVQPIRKKA